MYHIIFRSFLSVLLVFISCLAFLHRLRIFCFGFACSLDVLPSVVFFLGFLLQLPCFAFLRGLFAFLFCLLRSALRSRLVCYVALRLVFALLLVCPGLRSWFSVLLHVLVLLSCLRSCFAVSSCLLASLSVLVRFFLPFFLWLYLLIL